MHRAMQNPPRHESVRDAQDEEIHTSPGLPYKWPQSGRVKQVVSPRGDSMLMAAPRHAAMPQPKAVAG